ncbi:protein S100-G-like [Kryptolebias marmoratus]|uniref:protein S100-G-like n=1 Tax=Kryptolebias marmoratus TaxID=37003 RepID=UPI0007F8E426|nr:protein S100-G-like [Kryptolebias marmoratus]
MDCECNIKKAIHILKKCFEKYAKAEGGADTMTKKEVKTMFQAEFPELADALKDESKGKGQQEVCDLFKMLDEDGDGVVNFNEYIIFVATLSILFCE